MRICLRHTAFCYRVNLLSHYSYFSVAVFVISEQKRNAPDGAQADKRIYYSAEYTCLSAEYPRYQVKLEYADRPPVYTADNKKCERNFVEHNI